MFPLKGKFLIRNSSLYPSTQINIEDTVTQTVDAVRLIIASILQLRGIVASQECELVQLRSEVSRLRGLPLPLVRPPFTGFEGIGVGSGGLSLSGYNYPQNVPAPSYLAPLPTAAHPNILPATPNPMLISAAPITPNPNNSMLISAAPAATSTLNAAYSFFTTPAASTQASPAAATTTLHKPNLLFPNPDTFLPTPLNPAYNATSSSVPSRPFQPPEPGIPVTPPATGSRSPSTYTPSRPNKPSSRKCFWDSDAIGPYRQR